MLLIHRWRRGDEYYVVPGGGVEPGETIEEAARREIREETSLDIEDAVLSPLLDYEFDDPRHLGRQRYVAFSCSAPAGRAAVDLSSPEGGAASPSNRYELEWIDLDAVAFLPLHPAELKSALRTL